MDDFLDRIVIWRNAYRNNYVDRFDLTEDECIQFDILVGRGYFDLETNSSSVYKLNDDGRAAYEMLASMYAIFFQRALQS